MGEFIALLYSLVNRRFRRYLSRLLINRSSVRRDNLLLSIAIACSIVAAIIYLRRIFIVNVVTVLVVN